jgi:hypothetical protein
MFFVRLGHGIRSTCLFHLPLVFESDFIIFFLAESVNTLVNFFFDSFEVSLRVLSLLLCSSAPLVDNIHHWMWHCNPQDEKKAVAWFRGESLHRLRICTRRLSYIYME